jgi:glutaminyl-peptide cyclotransferase
MRVEVVETVPHDTSAFTQGLLFDDRGRLFESTGLEGRSTLREVDPDTGAVLRSEQIDPTIFAEGLALVDDRLIQITYQDGRAFVYDAETFEREETFEYTGEGWGLCYDGERLVMSTGSDTLTFRDPETFEPIGDVQVTMGGAPVELLNELECVEGKVYANLWTTNSIVVIDPASGEVETLIDASSLMRPAGADVLNGIAVDPEGGLWLTGKLWDKMYQVELVPAA